MAYEQHALTVRSRSTPQAWRTFWRHYLEMVAVMAAGMILVAAIFMVILNSIVTASVSWDQALRAYPVHVLLVVATGMSLPMIPWMRRMGHSTRRTYEMAALMAVLVVPFVCLSLFHVVNSAQCGTHCALGFMAMLGLMLLRRADYMPSTA